MLLQKGRAVLEDGLAQFFPGNNVKETRLPVYGVIWNAESVGLNYHIFEASEDINAGEGRIPVGQVRH